ncbi:YgfZ/GcvT domain-containing protein [uncultured Jatrophihabitans sp.]|uniref:CAF17-like 4Fe-4S cluster assembly/insertion protein YgfZ n=1 Tax=uncultured Jatrophihabitans sp. TaxID=1610747 RepID=UPI0035CA8C15
MTTQPVANLHAVDLHAVAAEGRDAGVPWHYGDPLREQRRLATGAGVVDRRNRDVLVVPGPDRLPWLHSICSQHVAALADGDSTEALVLSPHGHVEQHWQLTELGDQVWIDTEPGAAAEVLGYLRKMQFLKRVDPADVSAEWAVLTVVGPAAGTVVALAGLPVPPAVGRAVAIPAGGFVRLTPWPAPGAYDVIVPRPAADATLTALAGAGATPAGLWAFEALRVESRRPRLGAETDHRTIPHEVGWIGAAVHLDKGCYRGQETVARVQNLGRPPRRLVLVHLSGESDELPAPGTPVEFAGRAVGFLGTAVHHFELGPVALAVLKRSLPSAAELQVGRHVALVDEDPAADTGAGSPG